jgi:hypothetical protein
LVADDGRTIDGAADPSHADTAPVGKTHQREREEKGEGPRGRRSRFRDRFGRRTSLRRTYQSRWRKVRRKRLDGETPLQRRQFERAATAGEESMEASLNA